MARTCTPWKTEHSRSGAAPMVRRCADGSRAEIVSGHGYFAFNVYGTDGKWRTRGSAETLRAAKAAAARRMRRG